MALRLNLQKILCGAALAVAGLLGVVFLVDLAVGIPFQRFSWATDLIVLLACGLIIWQGIETWNEL